jgi:hypothetical protein
MIRKNPLHREVQTAEAGGASARALAAEPDWDVTMDGVKGLIWFGVGVMFALSCLTLLVD